MGLKIITDSGSEITKEVAKELDVIVLPLNVRFGNEEFKAGETLSNEEFYNKLIETDEFPKTSQISPAVYEETFEEIAQNGDEAIYISISSNLSGTMQSAIIGAEDYEDSISIVDSRQASAGVNILVKQACIYRKEGFSREEIVQKLIWDRERIKTIALFDTLEYLKKGGRISAAAAAIGGALSIKPVIKIEDGIVKVIGKAKGSRNGQNKLMEFVKSSRGIDFECPLCLVYTGLEDTMLKKYIVDSSILYEGYMEELPYVQAGPVIGTYAGPGAIGFAYFEKE
jgi:DegV family protein with EDD domain